MKHTRSMTLLVLFLMGSTTLQAAAHKKLYVLHSNSDTLSVIDVVSNKELKTIQVGNLPHGIASPASHEVLWVSAEGDDSLTLIDTRRDEVLQRGLRVGRRPNEIDVTSDGSILYVPALGDGVYEVFDTRLEKVVARIPTDGFPHNALVSPDDSFMVLSPMDRGDRPIERLQELGLQTSLNENIYVVDLSNHSVVAKIPTGDAPRPIALSPDGKRLFVNRDELMGFLVIDLEKRAVVAEVTLELTEEERATASRCHGIGVTPDGREVWTTDINHGLVFAFDLTQDPPRQIARMQTGRSPLWLTITPDGQTVYVANTADDSISAFDVATKTEKARIQLAKGTSPKRMLALEVPLGEDEVPSSSR